MTVDGLYAYDTVLSAKYISGTVLLEWDTHDYNTRRSIDDKLLKFSQIITVVHK